MPLTNAELLDIVRRLRNYMSTIDNIHTTLNSVLQIDDVTISTKTSALLSTVAGTNAQIAQLLRQIEASKSYRDMAKKFNIKEEEDN